jgi:hypothetical protein
MKQNSVNAASAANAAAAAGAGAAGNVPHDFDTRTGVAAALPAYAPPAGLPAAAGGTVAQLSGKEPLQLMEDTEMEKKKKAKGKLIVTYE